MSRALLLLLAASTVAAVAVAQPSGVADLAASGVRLTPAPSWAQGVPTDGNVTYEVTNQGGSPAMYRVDFSWRDASGATTPLNGDAASSFDVARQPLGGGMTRTHRFPWTLQPGQAGPGRVVVAVTIADRVDGDASDDRAELAADIAQHRIEMAMADDALTLAPDATGFVRVTLRNDGNRAEDVPLAVKASAIEPRMRHRLADDALHVAPGAVATTHLLVTFAPGGDFAPASLNYTVNATPAFTAPLALKTAQVRDGPAQGLDGFGFEMQGPADAVHLPTTGSADYVLRLTNKGTRQDNFTFARVLEPGWAATVIPADACLNPGETQSVVVRVTPPAGVPPGASADLAITTRGSLDPTTATHTASLRVGGAAPQVADVAFPTPYAGVPLNVTASLRNAGDAALPASKAAFRWTAGAATQQVLADVPAVAAGATRDLSAFLPAPPSGGALAVEVEWPAGTATNASRATFVHAPMVLVTPPEPLNASAGQELGYRVAPHAFRVRNIGNAEETVTLAAEATLGTATPESAALTLAPGETRTAPLAFRLPDTVGTVPNATVRLVVRVPAANAEWRSAVVTPIKDVDPPLVAPVALPRTWPVGAPLDFVANVTDAGQVARVDAVLLPPAGANRTFAMFPSHGLWKASTVLDLEGTYRLVLRASDRAFHNVTVDAGELRAVPAEPLRLAWTPPSGPVTAGTLLRLEVGAQVPVLSVEVSVVQGRAVSNQSVPVQSGEALVTLAGVQPGPVRLQAVATDWQGQVARANLTLQVAPPATFDPAAVKPASSEPRESPSATVGAMLSLLLVALVRRTRQ